MDTTYPLGNSGFEMTQNGELAFCGIVLKDSDTNRTVQITDFSFYKHSDEYVLKVHFIGKGESHFSIDITWIDLYEFSKENNIPRSERWKQFCEFLRDKIDELNQKRKPKSEENSLKEL